MTTRVNLPRYGAALLVASTLDELRALPGEQIETGAVAILTGALLAGDGAGGTFAWLDASTAADDGSTTIAPTDGTAGRWVKISTSDKGDPGANALNPIFSVSAANLAPGATPTASISGNYPNLAVNFGVVRGTDGATPSLTAGSVTTLSAGSAATAAVVSTGASSYRVDFGIPRGASGSGSGDMLKSENLSGLASTSAARGNLGLGSAATATIGTSGATVPLLSTSNTWGAQQLFPTPNNGTTGAARIAANATSGYAIVQFVNADGSTELGHLRSDSTGVLRWSGQPVYNSGNDATASDFRNATANRVVTPAGAWSAAAPVALADNTTIAVDMSQFLNASVTLAGNRTLGSPTNAKPGQSGFIAISQDATGGRTLTFASGWKFPGGTAPTLSATANAVDILHYEVFTPGFIVVTGVIKAVA